MPSYQGSDLRLVQNHCSDLVGLTSPDLNRLLPDNHHRAAKPEHQQAARFLHHTCALGQTRSLIRFSLTRDKTKCSSAFPKCILITIIDARIGETVDTNPPQPPTELALPYLSLNELHMSISRPLSCAHVSQSEV